MSLTTTQTRGNDDCRILGIDIGSILIVGGEAFGLIGFDENSRYRSFRTNTSCAAGTGSFLDQQARRLNLDGADALSERACSNRGRVPKIASRCAGSFHTKIELHSMLKSIKGSRVGFLDVSRAYDKACEYGESRLEKWKKVYERESLGRKDLHVVRKRAEQDGLA